MRIRTSVQAHLSALCLSTIMSSNCSPAFNRWMTGYFTFQQTAAMRIRWMEKWKSFFRIGRKSSRHQKSHFAPKLISKPKPRQDSLFSTGTKKSGEKRECHLPGMESTFPLYFSSPYFCREWNRDKNRNSRVIFSWARINRNRFCCVVDVGVVVADVVVVVVIIVIAVVAADVVGVVVVVEVVSWLIQVDLRWASNY